MQQFWCFWNFAIDRCDLRRTPLAAELLLAIRSAPYHFAEVTQYISRGHCSVDPSLGTCIGTAGAAKSIEVISSRIRSATTSTINNWWDGVTLFQEVIRLSRYHFSPSLLCDWTYNVHTLDSYGHWRRNSLWAGNNQIFQFISPMLQFRVFLSTNLSTELFCFCRKFNVVMNAKLSLTAPFRSPFEHVPVINDSILGVFP